MSEDHVLDLTKLRTRLVETRRKLAVPGRALSEHDVASRLLNPAR